MKRIDAVVVAGTKSKRVTWSRSTILVDEKRRTDEEERGRRRGEGKRRAPSALGEVRVLCVVLHSASIKSSGDAYCLW